MSSDLPLRPVQFLMRTFWLCHPNQTKPNHYSTSKQEAVKFVQGKSSDLELSSDVQLVILVKSADEYNARMLREHRRKEPKKSEDQVKKESHMGFWISPPGAFRMSPALGAL